MHTELRRRVDALEGATTDTLCVVVLNPGETAKEAWRRAYDAAPLPSLLVIITRQGETDEPTT